MPEHRDVPATVKRFQPSFSNRTTSPVWQSALPLPSAPLPFLSGAVADGRDSASAIPLHPAGMPAGQTRILGQNPDPCRRQRQNRNSGPFHDAFRTYCSPPFILLLFAIAQYCNNTFKKIFTKLPAAIGQLPGAARFNRCVLHTNF